MLDRRRFLALPFAAPLLTASVTPAIRSIEVFPAIYGVTSYFRFFPKPERPSVIVKITAEDGTVGWGQSVPLQTWSYETLESTLAGIQNYLAPAITGKSPFDLTGVHLAMKKAIANSFSTGAPISKAGVDLALHDLIGRLTSQTLPQRWGRKPLPSVTLSWTVNARTMAEAEELLEAGRTRGYKNFNLKVAPDPKFDLELVRKAREFAPTGFLWIDANGTYEPATALEVAPKFARLGVDVFEQPVAPNRISALQALKRQGALPIILDEGVVHSSDLMEFIRLNMLDGVAMKPARTAGLYDAVRQVEILEDAGLMFLGSGLTDPDLSLAASLQLFAAFNLKYPAALNGPQFLSGTYLRKPIEVKDGAALVPQGPGLGVEVDESKLRKS
jgi:L-alanine-DL-glutamate epimerase-like enolase superfamily enzyme